MGQPGSGSEHGAVIAMADGTIHETRERLLETDSSAVSRTIVTEIAGRTTHFDPPPEPTSVQLELTSPGSEPDAFLLTVGPNGPAVAPGRSDSAPVRISQDLAEMLRAVYGTEGARHDSTRSVWIVNEPGPETSDPDDPWLVSLRAATLAAGQVLSASSAAAMDLGALARRFGSDKWGDHFYTPHYARHFEEYRDQRVNLLEIGIGGFEDPNQGGESLSMWKAYFRRGLIYGLDLFDKSALDEPRIQTIQGDQADRDSLTAIAAAIGPLDIVIDDGSHLSDHVLGSFMTLFPLVTDGGMYVIEDLHTAYWPGWNGNRSDRSDPGTTTGFLKTLVDGLHHQDQMPEADSSLPGEIERSVRAVHLYHNIAFIEKGVNAEQTAPSWVRRHESDMDLEPKGSMRRMTSD